MPKTAPSTTTTPPLPGQLWPEQGGIFAGIGFDPSTQQAYALILAEQDVGDHAWGKYGQEVKGAASYSDGPANTAAMVAAGSPGAQAVAALQAGGFADWYIPSQAEAHLLAATCKHLMKPEWYWTSTQYSRYFAWIQSFGGGVQNGDYKDGPRLVRPVRRFNIRSFGPFDLTPSTTPAQANADVCTEVAA